MPSPSSHRTLFPFATSPTRSPHIVIPLTPPSRPRLPSSNGCPPAPRVRHATTSAASTAYHQPSRFRPHPARSSSSSSDGKAAWQTSPRRSTGIAIPSAHRRPFPALEGAVAGRRQSTRAGKEAGEKAGEGAEEGVGERGRKGWNEGRGSRGHSDTRAAPSQRRARWSETVGAEAGFRSRLDVGGLSQISSYDWTRPASCASIGRSTGDDWMEKSRASFVERL